MRRDPRVSRLAALLVRVLVVLALAGPGAAWAQDNPAYQAAHGRGTTAFNSGQFAECAEEFRQAFNIEPRGNLLYNIAFCYEKANDLPNAITFYQRFIDAVPTSPKRPTVQRHLAELKAQIEDQFVEISVSSDPLGALIYVNDKGGGAMGTTPVTFKLLPGSYLIIGEFDGHEPSKRKVDVVQGSPVTVDLNLVPSGQIGSITLLITERDADVLVDNRKVGKSPLNDPLRLKQGRHEIIVSKQGFANWTRTLEVQPGATESIKVDLAQSGAEEGGGEASASGGGLFSGPRLLPTITVAAGLGAVAGGAVMGLSAAKLHDDLKKRKDAGEAINSKDIDTGKSRVLFTNVLLGGGGAAVVGGAVWWFMAGSSAAEVAPSISATVGPDGGLVVWGNF